MAYATARPTFTFNLSSPLTPKLKAHLKLPLIPAKTFSIATLFKHHNLKFTSNSIDVSKEDKPISEDQIEETPTLDMEESPDIDPKIFDKRRLEEKFAVLNTGIYECRSCGYLFNEAAGDPSFPVPPGLPFDQIPVDWRCPTCGAAKSFFQSKSVEIAGFAQNQQYGLGGNALTSGQKALLIYGSLLLGFVFFLSGYFLQ